MTELKYYCVDKMSLCDRTCSQTSSLVPTDSRLDGSLGRWIGRWVVGSFHLLPVVRIKMLIEK
jgi:hypothetical protein